MRRILILGASLAIATAMRESARGLAELDPLPKPGRDMEPDIFRATADAYEPPNDVRRLRRQQYARERRTPPQLSKAKGRR